MLKVIIDGVKQNNVLYFIDIHCSASLDYLL